MSIEKSRAQIIAAVWQSIAQSGVDLSAVSAEQQEKLVGKIADGVLLALDSLLDEEAPALPAVDDVDDGVVERLLWKGRPFLSLTESYLVTSERIKIIKGLLSRDVENFELIRIQDIDFKQGISERLLGIGDITIRGHDASDPRIELRNVSKPEYVYEVLRTAWLEARKRHGLQFREYM